MHLQTFNEVVSHMDAATDGEGYFVAIMLNGGHTVVGAWHRHRNGVVRVDANDVANQFTLVDVSAIAAVKLVR